jgi:hypothetical protein
MISGSSGAKAVGLGHPDWALTTGCRADFSGSVPFLTLFISAALVGDVMRSVQGVNSRRDVG